MSSARVPPTYQHGADERAWRERGAEGKTCAPDAPQCATSMCEAATLWALGPSLAPQRLNLSHLAVLAPSTPGSVWGSALCDVAPAAVPADPSPSTRDICDGIRRDLDAFRSQEQFVFTVSSDEAHTHSPFSLPYWLSRCEIAVPMIVLRPFAHSDAFLPICLGLDCSYCNIKYVEGFPSTAGGAGDAHGSFCIEDVLASTGRTSFAYWPSLLLLPTDALTPHARDLRRLGTFLEIEATLLAARNLPIALTTHFLAPRASAPSDAAPTRSLSAYQVVVPAAVRKAQIIAPRVVADSVALVLVFVHAFHLQIAQTHIHNLKRNCEVQTCHLYVKYSVFPIYDYDEAVAREYAQVVSDCASPSTDLPAICADKRRIVQAYLGSMPDDYAVLMAAHNHIVDVATEIDVVYVLNGLTALFAFPQPAIPCDEESPGATHPKPPRENLWPRTSCAGPIPAVVYGKKQAFHLPNAVVVAAQGSVTCVEDASSERGEIGLGEEALDVAEGGGMAMAGTAQAMVVFIEGLQQCYRSHAVSSHSTAYPYCVSSLAKAYGEANPTFVGFDVDEFAFAGGAAIRLVRYLASLWPNADETTMMDTYSALAGEAPVMRAMVANLSALLRSPTALSTESYILSSPRPPSSDHLWDRVLSSYDPARLHPKLFPLLEIAVPEVQLRRPTACRIIYTQFLKMVNEVYALALHSNEWYSGLVGLAHVVGEIEHCLAHRSELLEGVANMICQMGRYVSAVVYFMDLESAKASLALVENLLVAGQRHGSSALLLCASALRSAFASEFGDVPAAKRLHMQSLLADPALHNSSHRPWSYSAVAQRRPALLHSHALTSAAVVARRPRTQPTAAASPSSGLHFVTYASNHTLELTALLTSAALAGIPMHVLGMGEPYEHFGDKIRGYNKFLQREGLRPFDVVMLVDAYDVLVFAQARKAAQVMGAITRAPLFFCAEAGIYPEANSAFFYQRGAERARLGLVPRFLNSGCAVGAVWALRELFAYMALHSYSVNDDQQLVVRYLLTHPDLLAADVDMHMMLTAYKQFSFNLDPAFPVERGLYVTKEMDLFVSDQAFTTAQRSILVLHANNRRSSGLYEMVNRTLFEVMDKYYPRSNRSALLEELWDHVDATPPFVTAPRV